MTNTIVANNSSGGDCSNSGTFNSGDYNLDSDSTCPINMANDISGGNADLQSLGDNGGTTDTYLPGPGSDAIDNGPATCSSPDQRGQVRPLNGVCEIGAVEIIPPADVCVNLWTGVLQQPRGGACDGSNLRKVVFEDNGPHYLCANLYTGTLSYSYASTCQPYNLPAIVMPDQAPLDVCLKHYTGQYRLPRTGQACTAAEYETTLQ
ncbi:MAG: choice-of-anchor Q domain-containing protein [Thermomicrobiales bacterium]